MWLLELQGALEAFGSLRASVRLRGLTPLLSLSPLLPLACLRGSPSLPSSLGSSWGFWGLRKAWESSAAMEVFDSLGASDRLRDLAPIAPLPLTLSLPHPFPLGLTSSLEAFISLWTSVRLGRLAPIVSFTPQSPSPITPWTSLPPEASFEPLEPQEVLEAFGSLGTSVILRDLAPLAPFTAHSSSALGLPGSPGSHEAPGSLENLWVPQSHSEALLPSSSSPPCYPLPCLRGSLGPAWFPGTFPGPLEPQEALEDLAVLGLSETQGPCSPCSPHPLVPCTLSSPRHLSLCGSLLTPWGPWSLKKPWKPSAVLGLQSNSGTLHPLTSLPPWLPWPPGASRLPVEPQQVLEAFSSLGVSVRLRSLALLALIYPLAPLTPPHPLGLPAHTGASFRLLEPQEALEAFSSLGASVRLRGLAPLVPFTLLTPFVPGPFWLPWGLWSLRSLWQSWGLSQTHGLVGSRGDGVRGERVRHKGVREWVSEGRGSKGEQGSEASLPKRATWWIFTTWYLNLTSQWAQIHLSNQMEGFFSQFYFIHRLHNNVWNHSANLFFAKLYLVIIASYETELSLAKLMCNWT